MFRKTLRKVLRTYIRSPRPYTRRKVLRVQSLQQNWFRCVEQNKTLKQNYRKRKILRTFPGSWTLRSYVLRNIQDENPAASGIVRFRLPGKSSILCVCVCISHIIQLTPQERSAEPKNIASAEALTVARRPKEASWEKTRTATGIEMFCLAERSSIFFFFFFKPS